MFVILNVKHVSVIVSCTNCHLLILFSLFSCDTSMIMQFFFPLLLTVRCVLWILQIFFMHTVKVWVDISSIGLDRSILSFKTSTDLPLWRPLQFWSYNSMVIWFSKLIKWLMTLLLFNNPYLNAVQKCTKFSLANKNTGDSYRLSSGPYFPLLFVKKSPTIPSFLKTEF